MREILFRGKRKDNGEWIEGSLLLNKIPNSKGNKEYIATSETDRVVLITVDPSTVGQYTGIKDKNGKKIFEEDIVKVRIERADFITCVTWGKNSRGWKLKCDRTNIDSFGTIKYYSLPSPDRIEVLGNIHDNID